MKISFTFMDGVVFLSLINFCLGFFWNICPKVVSLLKDKTDLVSRSLYINFQTKNHIAGELITSSFSFEILNIMNMKVCI